MKMQQNNTGSLQWLYILFFSVLLSGCFDGSGSNNSQVVDPPLQVVNTLTIAYNLSGTQEVPSVMTSA